jgi:hypothetical protein
MKPLAIALSRVERRSGGETVGVIQPIYNINFHQENN